MKVFPKSLNHNGQLCDVYFEEVFNFGVIEDNLIEKVHAICIYKGKLLVVHHPEWNIWGIPGGTREGDETIDETLRREIQEETNCEITSCFPLSYLKVVDEEGNFHYRVHFFCNVKPIAEFEVDPAGNIGKIEWINPSDFERYIEENKEFKTEVVKHALDTLHHFNSDFMFQ